MQYNVPCKCLPVGNGQRGCRHGSERHMVRLRTTHRAASSTFMLPACANSDAVLSVGSPATAASLSLADSTLVDVVDPWDRCSSPDRNRESIPDPWSRPTIGRTTRRRLRLSSQTNVFEVCIQPAMLWLILTASPDGAQTRWSP